MRWLIDRRSNFAGAPSEGSRPGGAHLCLSTRYRLRFPGLASQRKKPLSQPLAAQCSLLHHLEF